MRSDLSDWLVEFLARQMCAAQMRQKDFVPKVFVSYEMRNFRISRCLAIGDYERWPIYSKVHARVFRVPEKGGMSEQREITPDL